MKILVSDNLSEVDLQRFKSESGFEVAVKTNLPPEALAAIIADYDALVIRGTTKVTDALLDRAARLKVIGRVGTGLDNVDIPAATKRGVVVMSTPAGNAVTTAEQIISFLNTGAIVSAVNVPSLTGESLTRLRPYLILAEKVGKLQAQLSKGPVKKVEIIYQGDFQGLDFPPVGTAVLKGLLTPMVTDDVNCVNSPIIAREMGIKVAETTISESDHFINLITVRITTSAMTTTVSGTLFGKSDPRVVRINNFGLELIPDGHLALIYNQDKPGAIGSIGTTLGKHLINISHMQVGQDEDGENNIIFLRTDTPIPAEVLTELRELPLVNTVTPLMF